MKMKEIVITEVTFYPLRPNEKGLIGFASLTFDNNLSLNSIAVYTRPNGDDYRLVFPVKRLPNGREVNIFYPINKQVGETIKKAITRKIEELAEKVKGERVYVEKGINQNCPI